MRSRTSIPAFAIAIATAANTTLPMAAPLRNVLLFATGSVATIKLPAVVQSLVRHGFEVRVILSPSAERFLGVADRERLAADAAAVYRNEDEWTPLRPGESWQRGDPVLHIELRNWADLMLVAPLSANSLARIAGGLCDGLGLGVIRAWDTAAAVAPAHAGGAARRKKIFVAPAMNTHMFLHPLTEEHLAKLRSWPWFEVLDPVEKRLACGDTGIGGLMEPGDLVRRVFEELDPSQ